MRDKLSIKFGDLVKARFVGRPNRFLVRCRLEESGQTVEAHLADPGRLKELLLPDSLLYLRFVDNPKRRTRWSVILVEAQGQTTLVSLQSILANRLAEIALQNQAVAGLEDWVVRRSEYSYGTSRWDFLLENAEEEKLLLEVKSCTLVQESKAMFPDAVTERGKRHVEELTKLQTAGEFAAAVLFVVQRADATSFAPAWHIDPGFAKALHLAHNKGVQVIVHRCSIERTQATWGQQLPIHFS